MSADPACCFIVNPQSAAGRTKKVWPSIARQVTAALGEVSVRFTTGPGDATHQARAALEEGHRLLVSVGGDGTNNEVINGMFEEDGSPVCEDACFAFYPSGSGGDLRRSLYAPPSPEALIELIQKGHSRPIDLGVAHFSDAHGVPQTRFFLNISSFGISSMVNHKVHRSSKPFGGAVAFYSATIASFFQFQNPRLTFSLDDGPPQTEVCHLAVVANGRYFGGGMKVAPDASMDDGLFEFVKIGDMSRSELMVHSSKLYKGTHIHLDKVEVQQASKVSIDGPKELLIDVDGELPGRLPVTFSLLPGQLKLWTIEAPPQ